MQITIRLKSFIFVQGTIFIFKSYYISLHTKNKLYKSKQWRANKTF